MKNEFSNIIRSVVAGTVVGILFIYTFMTSIHGGDRIATALFSAILVTFAVLLIIGLLFVLWWRLFTLGGRKAEAEAQAQHDIRKLERKRTREWRRMNQ